MSNPPSGIPDRLEDLKLRPGERVLRYLLQEFDRSELKHGARLPSNRELARRLDVSVPTVQSVLKALSREGRIEARHGSGTYLVSRPQSAKSSQQIVISALLHPDEKLNDPWMNAIISGFMPVALRSRPTTFVGIAPEKFGTDESVTALLAELPAADGLIIMPYALMPNDRDRIAAAYEKAGKPVVYLNPPDIFSTANFVATDYLRSAQTLGRVWRETGRRRVIVFAITEKYEYAISSQLRLMGLAAGLGPALGESLSLQMIESDSAGKNNAYQLMKAILKDTGSGPVPDAILVPAAGAQADIVRALREQGLRIPEDVSLVATEKISTPQAGEAATTVIHEPAQPLSRHLLEMLFARMDNQGASLPGRYVPATFLCGATTRPKENALLQAYAK